MDEPMNPSIVIADDHSMFRQGLRALLDRQGFAVVAEAGNGHEAIQEVSRHRPSLALIDFNMPLLNGIDAAREMQKRSPKTRVLLLTMFEDEDFVLEALKAGIRGYVMKSQASAELTSAINEVLKGSIYLSPGISEAVFNAYKNKRDQPAELLTDRERQVLQLVAEGHTTKQTASVLNLSVKTIESHRTHIMQKLGVHDTAGLVRYAIRRGIIKI